MKLREVVNDTGFNHKVSVERNVLKGKPENILVQLKVATICDIFSTERVVQ